MGDHRSQGIAEGRGTQTVGITDPGGMDMLCGQTERPQNGLCSGGVIGLCGNVRVGGR